MDCVHYGIPPYQVEALLRTGIELTFSHSSRTSGFSNSRGQSTSGSIVAVSNTRGRVDL
jgi:hypothetical protein